MSSPIRLGCEVALLLIHTPKVLFHSLIRQVKRIEQNGNYGTVREKLKLEVKLKVVAIVHLVGDLAFKNN